MQASEYIKSLLAGTKQEECPGYVNERWRVSFQKEVILSPEVNRYINDSCPQTQLFKEIINYLWKSGHHFYLNDGCFILEEKFSSVVILQDRL